MKKVIDYKLTLKPILTGFYHDYVFEGPCRFGKGEMLTKEFDLSMITNGKKRVRAEIQNYLGEICDLLPAYDWDRNEEFLIKDDKLEAATADAAQADAIIVPDMSRNTDILIAVAEKTRKPILMMPPASSVGVCKNIAALRARGFEAYGFRSWEDMIDQLEVMRVKKVLANTKILCVGRFGTSMTPSAGDTLIDPNVATEKLGVHFVYANIHEFVDQTHVGESEHNQTLPGRKALNPTEEEVKEIEAMADELIAGADNCYMSREAVFDSFRAHWTIKKMLEYYNCNAFTIPCPDICATRRINEERYTFCMNHSLLNELGIPSACEYDMATAIALVILEAVGKSAAYMGNLSHSPYYIKAMGKLPMPYFYNLSGTCDTEYLKRVEEDYENTLFLQHSVGSRKLHGFDSSAKYDLRPYTGSGWGVTIRYDFNQDAGQEVTFCRIDPSCSKLFVAKGTIVAGRGQDDNGCSLGVFIRVKDGKDFFNKQLSIGNHVPIVYGDYFERICQLGNQLGLEVITA